MSEAFGLQKDIDRFLLLATATPLVEECVGEERCGVQGLPMG